MPILNFKKEWADDVASGKKRSTIRRTRKVPINANDTLHLYTGLRTRATRRLGVGICNAVKPIVIYPDGDIRICGVLIDPADEADLIRTDGFKTKTDFLAFFIEDNQTFYGDLILWTKLESDDA